MHWLILSRSIGIAHDPEVETAYGSVFWAFDTTGDNGGDGGQLVRFDFSQPHGPGSMDHSIAGEFTCPLVPNRSLIR